MEQPGYEQRGYLHEEFHLFHLTSEIREPVDWHYHAFHKLCVYLGGSAASYGIEGRSYVLEPGDIILVPQGSIHRPELAPGAAYDRMILYLSPDFLRKADAGEAGLETCFLQAAASFRFVVRTGSRSSALLRRLFQLERALKEDGFAQALLAQSLLYAFVIELTRSTQSDELVFAGASACDEKIAAILQYLSHDPTENISIDALASKFYISKYHMMRRFRAQTGYTIHAYLVGKRLMLARELIADGTPVMEAAALSGFGDYSAFSRAYRRQFGAAPAAQKRSAAGI